MSWKKKPDNEQEEYTDKEKEKIGKGLAEEIKNAEEVNITNAGKIMALNKSPVDDPHARIEIPILELELLERRIFVLIQEEGEVELEEVRSFIPEHRWEDIDKVIKVLIDNNKIYVSVKGKFKVVGGSRDITGKPTVEEMKYKEILAGEELYCPDCGGPMNKDGAFWFCETCANELPVDDMMEKAKKLSEESPISQAEAANDLVQVAIRLGEEGYSAKQIREELLRVQKSNIQTEKLLEKSQKLHIWKSERVFPVMTFSHEFQLESFPEVTFVVDVRPDQDYDDAVEKLKEVFQRIKEKTMEW